VHPPAERTHVLKRSGSPRELPAAPDARIETVAKRALTKDTLALLLIDKGSIAFEQYASDVSEATPLFALSVTKSLVALAAGEALCSGKIKSLDDLAGVYSAELSGSAQGKASIRHLLMMASGADPFFLDGVNEGVNWKDFMGMFAGDLGVGEYVRRDSRPKREPGSTFQYNGRDTSAISLAIEGATGMKFQEWFDVAVWRKAGAASEAYFRIAAKDGRAIAEAGLWIAPKDLARIALLAMEALREGSACTKQYLSDAIKPRLGTAWNAKGYGYQMWIDARGVPQFVGHGGQMLMFDPKSGRMLVVFGHNTEWEPMERLFHAWLGQQ
jgi:CubicO group peptidase (beta-lactamase class C family)